ncbi:OmpA family protein [Marinilongibacter aquaticus]|uniref:OmpA family protein n=1 Tax=Marinilongibacter aquaticus TaxID=2975157 RepID=UPI0021BDE53B|nr:OmpA family protein [Marinilongibacter aquaticus]UBM57870.1 OmpA family protein [Marinilongibacter aquaticus]
MNRVIYGFVLLFFCKNVLAQNEGRIGIRPTFGLGMNLPQKVQTLGGDESLKYAWKFFHLGLVVDQSGDRQFTFNLTNRAGLELNYRPVDPVELLFGAEQMTLLYTYKNSLRYSLGGHYVQGFYEKMNFWNGLAGLRIHGYNFFYTLGLRYGVKVLSNKWLQENVYAGPLDFRNENGTGVVYTYSLNNFNRFNLHLGFGQDVEILGAPGSVEIGLNLAKGPILKERVDNYRDYNPSASFEIAHNANAFFVSLSQSFYFKRSTKENVLTKQKEHKDTKVRIGKKEVALGEGLVLESIQFEQSKAHLLPEAREELETVLRFMLAMPTAVVEFSGHTSNEGDRSQNIKLSEERAEACKQYLVERGVKAKRIRTVGYGPDKPLSEKNQAINRRVELQIISLD